MSRSIAQPPSTHGARGAYTEKTTNRLLKLFRFLWGRGSRD